MTSEELTQLSQMYAFLGNSLLKPMNQTAGPGLDPAFWAALPDFGSAKVDAALDELFTFAEAVANQEDAVIEVAAEHTRLFVGPPSPAAAPWETYYPAIPEDVDPASVPTPTSGFGEPAFAMKALLCEAGLVLAGESNQFEDHIGVELLYLSVLYARAAEGEEGAVEKAETFIHEHPGRWIGCLMTEVEKAFPNGYVMALLRLAQAMMAL